jgi:intracellular multiplication protein IcmJ
LGIARPNTGNTFVSSHKTLPPDVRQRIWERDDHTCAFCGFSSKRYMDVVPADFSKASDDPDDFHTSCQFCAQCFDLESVVQMKSGFLIFMPEMSQAMLNHMARAIYVARVSQGPMADTARRLLDIVMQRREEAKSRIQTDDPFVLSLVLRDFLTSKKTYVQRTSKLEGVRLFPLDRRMVKEGDLEFNQFPQILAYWRSKEGPFGGKLPAHWVDYYRDVAKGDTPSVA